MSERTTIGGTVYEAIGSSSSNLLLKCNGTARIQWGSKLIDLIKNGKIASGDSLELVFIVTDESEIKSDGVYVLTTDESSQLWICKDGNKYDFTGTELYISASKELNLTVEQKKLALDNIGFLYDTYDELVNAKLQNGIVYVLETKTLYTIKDGVIEEFEAKLKSVTVEQGAVEGEVINSSTKIVLSILDEEYLILADLRITANYSIHVKESAQMGSESADKNQGYRLYIEGGTSWLDVDEINVRNGIKIKLYKEVVFEDFINLIDQSLLEPHIWYLITDYLNPWKLIVNNIDFNRPILVRALTENTLYEKGYLFRDHRITIKYDYTFLENIKQTSEIDGVIQETIISARGKITWMKDLFNNEANFDFLDYTDSNGKELTTLHEPYGIEGEEKSIFPTGSYNNKLIVYDLKGTVLKDGEFDNTNVTVIDFKFDDLKKEGVERSIMEMHDNDIECRGLVLNPTCINFCNNILYKAIKLEINSKDFFKNKFLSIYYHSAFVNYDFSKVLFSELEDNNIFASIVFHEEVSLSKCTELRHCSFSKKVIESSFGTIENCDFTEDLNLFTFNYVQRPVDTYRYTLLKITNSTIDKVINEAILTFEMIDSYIGTIENHAEFLNIFIDTCIIENINKSIILEDLVRSTFISIKESTISKKITDSIFGEILKSKILAEIVESTFEKIEESEINAIITTSSILTLLKSFINETITESTFELISNNSDIQNKIAESNFITLDKVITSGLINNSTFNLIKNTEISGDITNSIFGDITDSFIRNKITKSNIKVISLNTNITEEISDSIFNIITDSIISGTISTSNFDTVKKLTLTSSIVTSNFNIIDGVTISAAINTSTFDSISNGQISGTISNSTFTTITNFTSNLSISDSSFLAISNISFNASFSNVKFRKLTGGSIGEGTIAETVSFYDLDTPNFNSTEHPLLYITTKRKEIYIHYEKIFITCIPDVVFYRGMIIMHSGAEDIPLGWALCDGNEYEFDGRKIKTPDLRKKFIKATETLDPNEVKASDKNNDLNADGKLKLKAEHLPEHHHPHKEHIHSIDKLSVSVDPEEITVETNTTVAYWYTDATVSVGGESTTDVIGDITWKEVKSVGSHSHTASISGGSLSGATSEEDTQTWLNNEINIEPDHYSLIFIMKL